MYERWTVGDDPNTPPTAISVPAYDGLPPGVGSFQYLYDSQTDINTPYILHVHGSNMEPWEKDRFAETMSNGFTGKVIKAGLGRFDGRLRGDLMVVYMILLMTPHILTSLNLRRGIPVKVSIHFCGG